MQEGARIAERDPSRLWASAAAAVPLVPQCRAKHLQPRSSDRTNHPLDIHPGKKPSWTRAWAISSPSASSS